MEKKYLTFDETKSFFGISSNTLKSWVALGKIETLKIKGMKYSYKNKFSGLMYDVTSCDPEKNKRDAYIRMAQTRKRGRPQDIYDDEDGFFSLLSLPRNPPCQKNMSIRDLAWG